MKILMLEWKAYGQQDIRRAFLAEGHSVVQFPFSTMEDVRQNVRLNDRVNATLSM